MVLPLVPVRSYSFPEGEEGGGREEERFEPLNAATPQFSEQLFLVNFIVTNAPFQAGHTPHFLRHTVAPHSNATNFQVPLVQKFSKKCFLTVNSPKYFIS